MWKRGESIKLGSCLIETSSAKSAICLKINHSVFTIFFPKNLIFPIGSQAKVSSSEIKSNYIRKVMSPHPSRETNAPHFSSRLLFSFLSEARALQLHPQSLRCAFAKFMHLYFFPPSICDGFLARRL